MASEQHKEVKILVVEESDIISRVMISILGRNYTAVTAHSGNECLEKVASVLPTTLFMDVNLPDLSGYETCRKLKANPVTAHIPVIFVSSQDSVQEKMLGYDAGGDDFLSWPFHPPELLAKAKVSVEHHGHIHELKDQVNALAERADYASKAAFAAMRSSSDLGAINSFIRESYSAKDYYELANLLFNTMQQWNLNTTVQFRRGTICKEISESDYVPPLEKELISLLLSRGRIVEFGTRAVFNHCRVSILIKNMPSDAEACGILRDSIAILLESLEEKLRSMERELELKEERDAYLIVLKKIQTTVKYQEQKTMEVLDSLVKEMQIVFAAIDLAETEESQFERLLTNTTTQLAALYANGLELDTEFAQALGGLLQEPAPLRH